MWFKLYIGENKRIIQVRIKEHKVAITHNREKSSSLVEHFMRTKHHICIEDAKILARVDHLSKIYVREAMEIVKENKCIKKDDGLKLSTTWNPILHNQNLYDGSLVMPKACI